MTSVRLKDTTDVVRRPAWVAATEPTSDDTVTVGPGTLWIDDSTTPNVLKRRNDADDGWVAVGLVTGTTATTAAAGNHNHTHDSLTGRTTDNHHAKAHNFGDLTAHPDVVITSPATGHVPTYDAADSKWKNLPQSGGGVTLSSANPTTAAPSDAAAPGTGLSATRGDHRHGMPATWPPGSHAHSAHSGLGADDHTQYQLRSERAAASGYAPLDSGLLIPVANLGTGTPTGSKFLRDDRTWAVPAGGGGSLTIEEVDGTPSVSSATKLILPNGTVSVSGTEATYTPAGGSSALTRIAQTVLGSAAASITFSSIPGTYTDLVVVLNGRSTQAASQTSVTLTINSDTGANYDRAYWEQYGTTGSDGADTYGATPPFIGYVAGSTAPAGSTGTLLLECVGYARTVFHKMVVGWSRHKTAASVNGIVQLNMVEVWRSTSAITALSLAPTSGNFDTGTTATLYGRT